MTEYELIVDLHKLSERQGPGGISETDLAIQLAGLDKSQPLKIADIGCGTGVASIHLSRKLDAHITAVDNSSVFLDELRSRAEKKGVSDRISPLCSSMDALPFTENEFDVIWSEGAVYNIGFEVGISNWHRFIKPGGVLVVSEITWLTQYRPEDIDKYWQSSYTEIDLASAKIRVLEKHGYQPIAYFTLPEHCWTDNYYVPLQHSFSDFLQRHCNIPDAVAIVEAEQEEILMYEKYHAYFSYGVYIAKKLGSE